MLIPSSSSLIKSRLQRERERWREIVSDIKTWDPSRGVRQPKVFWHSRLLTSLAWAALSSSRNSPSHNSLAKLPGLLDFIIFDLWCDVMWYDVSVMQYLPYLLTPHLDLPATSHFRKLLSFLSLSHTRWWIKMWGTQSSLVSAELETFLVSSWELFSMVSMVWDILGTNTAMFSASLSHSRTSGRQPPRLTTTIS